MISVLKLRIIVDRLNQERITAKRKTIQPFQGPYPAPRAPEWDFIYDHFKADLCFDCSPPMVLPLNSDYVCLLPNDPESQAYLDSCTRKEMEPPRNTASANPEAEGSRYAGMVDSM